MWLDALRDAHFHFPSLPPRPILSKKPQSLFPENLEATRSHHPRAASRQEPPHGPTAEDQESAPVSKSLPPIFLASVYPNHDPVSQPGESNDSRKCRDSVVVFQPLEHAQSNTVRDLADALYVYERGGAALLNTARSPFAAFASLAPFPLRPWRGLERQSEASVLLSGADEAIDAQQNAPRANEVGRYGRRGSEVKVEITHIATLTTDSIRFFRLEKVFLSIRR